MPITNLTRGTVVAPRAAVADTVLGRMAGLLGTDAPDPNRALVLTPCKSIHTFGMQYPIDAVFFDREGTVVKVSSNLPPNRVSAVVPTAYGVAEFAPNTLGAAGIQVGDRLRMDTDESFRGDSAGIRRILRWPVNLFLGFLWGMLAVSSYRQFAAHGELVSLGLVLVNTFLLVLFVLRRESSETSQRPLDWMIPFLTIVFSLLLRPHPVANTIQEGISSGVQLAGILAILASLGSLGRSFGIIPARRLIKNAGAYRIIRHPLYASELLFYFGFLLGNISLFNALAVLFVLFGQIWRARAEEKLLGKNEVYSRYLTEVKYRLIPGVY